MRVHAFNFCACPRTWSLPPLLFMVDATSPFSPCLGKVWKPTGCFPSRRKNRWAFLILVQTSPLRAWIVRPLHFESAMLAIVSDDGAGNQSPGARRSVEAPHLGRLGTAPVRNLEAVLIASAWCGTTDFARLRKTARDWYTAFRFTPADVLDRQIELRHAEYLADVAAWAEERKWTPPNRPTGSLQ